MKIKSILRWALRRETARESELFRGMPTGDLRRHLVVSQANYALSKLGNTPDDIATLLSQCGATGQRNNSHNNPITEYLNMIMPTGFGTLRGVGTGAVLIDNVPGDDRGICFDTPPPVAAFLRKFDQGDYPELEDDE